MNTTAFINYFQTRIPPKSQSIYHRCIYLAFVRCSPTIQTDRHTRAIQVTRTFKPSMYTSANMKVNKDTPITPNNTHNTPFPPWNMLYTGTPPQVLPFRYPPLQVRVYKTKVHPMLVFPTCTHSAPRPSLRCSTTPAGASRRSSQSNKTGGGRVGGAGKAI